MDFASDLTCLILEREEGYALIRLNRPAALNALNSTMMDELSAVIPALDADPGIHAIILTGSEKAFAAGADIKEMAGLTFAEAVAQDFITRNWEAVTRCRKPVIAAVAGYALGGGCEVAMMCDIILAADTARFSQPEITLGIPPGAGGTQRLPRAVGKAKAMEMILTARMIGAEEAERAGLVSRVVPADKLIEEAKAVAAKIATLPPVAVQLAKELVNAAYETPLAQGIKQERRTFHAAFATEDQTEGMAAFTEKRKAVFKGQ